MLAATLLQHAMSSAIMHILLIHVVQTHLHLPHAKHHSKRDKDCVSASSSKMLERDGQGVVVDADRVEHLDEPTADCFVVVPLNTPRVVHRALQPMQVG